MNHQSKRIQTFYLLNSMKLVEKHFISMMGFYNDGNRLVCYRCETSCPIDSNSMLAVGSHHCHSQIQNHEANVDIPSPYPESGAINVQNDLNFEEFRYATFAKWPMASLVRATTVELASAGFYYCISPDILKCFYCKTTIECMVLPNRAFNRHKTNKMCIQKQYSFQIRLKNLTNDNFLSKARDKRTLRATPSIEQAGPSSMCTTCSRSTDEISSTPTSESMKQAFEDFLNDPDKNEIYNAALNLGIERHMVDTAVKRQLLFGNTIENVDDLVELCFLVQRNVDIAQTVSQKMKEIEREYECKICMNTKIEVIFKPCHHVVACHQCSHKIKRCPICCMDIKETSKIYF